MRVRDAASLCARRTSCGPGATASDATTSPPTRRRTSLSTARSTRPVGPAVAVQIALALVDPPLRVVDDREHAVRLRVLRLAGDAERLEPEPEGLSGAPVGSERAGRGAAHLEMAGDAERAGHAAGAFARDLLRRLRQLDVAADRGGSVDCAVAGLAASARALHRPVDRKGESRRLLLRVEVDGPRDARLDRRALTGWRKARAADLRNERVRRPLDRDAGEAARRQQEAS